MKDGIAVKAFIVDGGRLLSIKRRSSDVHDPEMWELPGGRLDEGEDPAIGFKERQKKRLGLIYLLGNI